jgi:hypothetical protein
MAISRKRLAMLPAIADLNPLTWPTDASLGLASLVLVSGAIVMTLFIFLAGVSNVTPLNNTYFLYADTTGITGARDRTQWTYFYVCGPGNVDCSGPWPAPSFGWAWSANAANLPSEILGDQGNASQYYYLSWRFMWVFYLIAMFFAVVAWFSGFLACCGRLGSALAGFSTFLALLFYTIAAALMTAATVRARNTFIANGHDAYIGTYAYGFTWGSWAALFIATTLFCIGSRAGKEGSSGGRSWGRKRSVRSRRSYDIGSSRRVKEDYA